jgi:hypothetical protein
MLPLVKQNSEATNSKSFSVTSLKQVILQVIAAPCYINLLVQLPIRGGPIQEFQHTKRFSNIHRDMHVASICAAYGHFFVGDIVFFLMDDERELQRKNL